MNRGVCVTSHLPKVHNKPLGLAGTKEHVIVSVSHSQVLHHSPVLWLSFVTDKANHQGVVYLIMVLEPCTGLQSWVKRKFRKGLSTQPWGMLVFNIMVKEVMFFDLTCCSLLVRKSSIQLQRKVLMPRLPILWFSIKSHWPEMLAMPSLTISCICTPNSNSEFNIQHWWETPSQPVCHHDPIRNS